MPIYLCQIFAEIPTYPKIGHPLWTFPRGTDEGTAGIMDKAQEQIEEE